VKNPVSALKLPVARDDFYSKQGGFEFLTKDNFRKVFLNIG
jgi:hypothetical protein